MTTPDIDTSEPMPTVTDRVSDAGLDEPTKAEILADVKTGLQQALAGEGRPAREVFAEIRRKLEQDSNGS